MLELARRGFALQAWSRRMKVVNCTALTTPKPIARRCFLARHYGITGWLVTFLECSSRNVSAPEPGYVGTAVASCLVDRYFSDSQGVCITRSELNGNRWQCKWFCVIGRFRWFQRRGDSCFLEFDRKRERFNLNDGNWIQPSPKPNGTTPAGPGRRCRAACQYSLVSFRAATRFLLLVKEVDTIYHIIYIYVGICIV